MPKRTLKMMNKKLLFAALLFALVSVAGGMSFRGSKNLSEFRCHLSDIKCDACRAAVSEALEREKGIVGVRFEGEERKDLVIRHRSERSVESLREALARIGYPPEALGEASTQAVSHQQCVCPVERAKLGFFK